MIDELMKMEDIPAFLTYPVRNWTFDGIFEELLEFGQNAPDYGLELPIPFDKFGWFYSVSLSQIFLNLGLVFKADIKSYFKSHSLIVEMGICQVRFLKPTLKKEGLSIFSFFREMTVLIMTVLFLCTLEPILSQILAKSLNGTT